MKNYERRIVAFIDILGFKKLIKESEKDSAKLDLIYESLTFLKTMEKPKNWDLKLIKIDENFNGKILDYNKLKDNLSCTAFSDSILISVKVEENEINEVLSSIVANIAFIGTKLMINGILLRGGITYDNMIHENDGITMGQGLIDAYELECNIAKNPRIILSDKLIKLLNYPNIEGNKYPYNQYFNRFEDGCVGFHQMSYLEVFQDEHSDYNKWFFKKILSKVRKIIVNGLDNSFESPNINAIYKWLEKEYKTLSILDKEFKDYITSPNAVPIQGIIHYSIVNKFQHEEQKNISVKVDENVVAYFKKKTSTIKIDVKDIDGFVISNNLKEKKSSKYIIFSNINFECIVNIIFSQIKFNKWTLGLDDEKKFSRNFIEFLLDTDVDSIFIKIIK